MGIIKSFKIKNFKDKQTIIELKNISKSFGMRRVLDNINININEGEILGILGPNGAGKSTILKTIIGIEDPDFGEILINDQDISKIPIYLRSGKFKLGYIPQRGGAIMDLTLRDNLQMVSEIHLKDKEEIKAKVTNLISQFNFEDVLSVKAKDLSGGQFKRCVIAMALINDPKIMLLDEIFSALDLKTIYMLKQLIINLRSYRGITCIMVDHLARDLLECADRSLILSDGKIVVEGKSEEIINNKLAKEVYFGSEFYLK